MKRHALDLFSELHQQLRRGTRSIMPTGRRRRRSARGLSDRTLHFESLEDRRLLATLTVNSPLDNLTAGDSLVTLREAIIAANNDAVTDSGETGSGADQIVFDPSLNGTPIVLALAGTGEDASATGDLDITTEIVIQGNGAANTVIDANGIDRVIHVLGSGDLTLDRLTITGGSTSSGEDGGGILTDSGTVATLTSVTVSNNSAGRSGGGIFSFGTLTVTDSTISDNSAADGGGIAAGAALTIVNATISDNSASNGGGILATAALTIVNSTISSNLASSRGGGISYPPSSFAASVTNSTIFGNSAGLVGGIYSVINHQVTINNSLVAGNSGGDLFNRFYSGTNNLIGAAPYLGLTNTLAGDPLLGPLQDNGGPTRTHAMLSGSPAIDAGDNAQVPLDVEDLDDDANATEPLPFDQRGAGYARILSGTVDIGAVEFTPPPSTILVTTAVDENDGLFDPNLGTGTSLREAIMAANSNPDVNTITFDSAFNGMPIVLTITGRGEDASATGDLDITTEIVIQGNGAANTVIDANGIDRVFHVLGSGNLTLDRLTIKGGTTSEAGGGIFTENGTTATLTSVTVSNNLANLSPSSSGGGISSLGTLSVTDSTISDNSSNLFGGGVQAFGAATIINSTISGNSTNNLGGGIATNQMLTIVNATISGNSASRAGGIYGTGASSVSVTNSTIFDNRASSDNQGGGILNANTMPMMLNNSLVAGNSGGDLAVTTVYSGTNNLIGDGSGGLSNTITGDPLLGPLQDNGGPTKTHALLYGSPAIDAGDNAQVPLDAEDLDGDANVTEPLPFDQRGAGYARILSGTVDIGAVEFTPPPSTILVTTTEDENDGLFDPGVGMGTSLREAIIAANSNPDVNTITFDPSLNGTPIVLALAGRGEDAAADGDLDITTEIVIQGNGAANTVIDANGIDRVIHVLGSGVLTLDGLTITGGGMGSGEDGGGILTESGTVATLTSVTVSNNSADGSGGGIASYGTLLVTDSTISGNSSDIYGGGIQAVAAATIINSTISGNSASYRGGGISGAGTNLVSVTNSTIFGNSASVDQGGGSGGIYSSSSAPAMAINNSLVANNSGGDLFSFVAYSGTNNLIEDGYTAGLSNTITGDPRLGPLQDNGGPTKTHALLSDSPAIDAGDDSLAVDSMSNPLTTDQRGTGFARILGAAVDIGAFEIALPPEIDVQGNSTSIADGDTSPDTADDTDFGSATAGSSVVTHTFTIQNTGTGDLTLSGSPIVAISGSSDFTISTQPASGSVAAAGSTTFIVTFTPTTVGTQTATISIANDDSDENPYDFVLQGMVTAAVTTELRFDLNGGGSPTAAGFVGVGAGTANAYTEDRGYGWVTAAGTFDQLAPTDLLRDGHLGTDNTFLVDLVAGDYLVSVTLGDANARELIDVYAEDELVFDDLATPAGQHVRRSFPVTILDSQLTLRFDDDGFDPLFTVNAIEVLAAPPEHSLSVNGTGTTISGSGATPDALLTVSTSLGSIASTTSDDDPNYAGVQVFADSNGDFSFDITEPVAAGTATITSEEIAGTGIGSTTFAYAGLGPAVQICDNEDGCFEALTYTLRTTWGFQGDTRFTLGDSSGDTATWTFTVDPAFDYRVSAYWQSDTKNRATNAPYEIFDGAALPLNSVGTKSVNQLVPTTDVVYTRVFDSGVWFADLGGPYTISGSTLTVTLDDAANDYVIADAIRIERLPALRAETAILDAASTDVLTGETATLLVDAGRTAWSLEDVTADARLSGVEVIVTDLPGKVLGLASEVSNTIWLDTNAAGHGWDMGRGSRVESREIDLLSVISHELGHVLGLPDLDPTAHAGDVMAARLPLGTRRLPMGGEGFRLTTLDVAQPTTRQSTRLVGDLFGDWWASQARPTLRDTMGRLVPRYEAQHRISPLSSDGDGLLAGDRDDLLSPKLDADLDHVVADRRLLSDLSIRRELPQYDRQLDEFFANADELLGTFDEKIRDE